MSTYQINIVHLQSFFILKTKDSIKHNATPHMVYFSIYQYSMYARVQNNSKLPPLHFNECDKT